MALLRPRLLGVTPHMAWRRTLRTGHPRAGEPSGSREEAKSEPDEPIISLGAPPTPQTPTDASGANGARGATDGSTGSSLYEQALRGELKSVPKPETPEPKPKPDTTSSSETKATEPPLLLSADVPPPEPPKLEALPPPKAETPPATDKPKTQEQVQEEWERKWAESKEAYNRIMAQWREALDKRIKTLAAHTGETLAVVSQKVNEVTGYREVEALKRAVKDRESDIVERRRAVRDAKTAYEDAVTTLSSTQQSVNALLERKHSWTDADVAQFTKLVRSDHASRSAVATTSEELKTSELAVDKAFTALMQSILERYHEEQVWSDKIRSVSTWAQVAALVANLIVFVGAIAFIEPWKRRRLVQGLEERMTGMMGRVEGEIASLSERVQVLDAKLGVAAATATPAATAAVMAEADGTAFDPASAAEVAAVESNADAGADAVQAETPPDGPAQVPNEMIDLMGGILSDVLSDVDVNATAGAAPLEQITPDAQSRSARSLHWISEQLDAHVAPPSPERDLAVASVVGAVAGATVVGLASVVAAYFRS